MARPEMDLHMIRKAEPKDAEGFCEVVRTSIIELCELDHLNDELHLADWLENKTVSNCSAWIRDSNSNSFVAEENGKIVGVSHIGNDGHLYLCYLLPSVKGKGIGAKLLIAAENSVNNLGLTQLTLESTLTAKGFYEHFGYKGYGVSGNCLKYIKSIKP